MAVRPLHGYAVMHEVAEMSGRRVVLQVFAVPGAGTLYAAMDRLTEEGHVEPTATRLSTAGTGGTTA